MKENPHPRGVLQDKDVEYVLERFEEEYERSLIRKKFTLDTTDATVEETFKDFLKAMEPHFRPIDTLRMLQHKFLKEEIEK